MRSLLGAGLLLALGCSRSPAPRYASWDPVLETLPRPPSRAEAARRLNASLRSWRRWLSAPPSLPTNVARAWIEPAQMPAYSYVRARQIDEHRVTFTLFDVAAGRVVMRAQLSADPDHLSSLPQARSNARDVQTLWVERGDALGRHLDGAPSKTIDDLYAECARAIATADADELPRLYFHPNGVLMQCGQPPSECSDCAAYSIQDFSHFSLSHERPENDAKLWTCATEAGVKLPLSPIEHGSFSCWPAFQRDPTFAARQAQLEAEQREAERCRDELATECPEPTPSSVSICQIDPAACAIEEPYRATWTVLHPSPCAEPMFARALGSLDVGKALPEATWQFPVVGGGCGLDRRAPEHQIYLRFVQQPDGSFAPQLGR